MAAVGATPRAAAAPDAHERSLAERGVRKGLGAYYTPPDVVEALLDLVLDPILEHRRADGPDAIAALRVLDPACGTGNFLVAVVHRVAAVLADLGVDPERALAVASGTVRGIEIDAKTSRVCRANLRAVHPRGGGRAIVRADALVDADVVPEGSFDLVIGNPPFLSQLGSATARVPGEAAALRERFGPVVAGYTDPAALFLVLGHRLARSDGGVVAMIQPVATLSAAGATEVRRAVLRDAHLTDLWVLGAGVFDAAVEVCAPVVVRGAGPGQTTQLHVGRGRLVDAVVEAPRPDDGSWSSLLADLRGLPRRRLHTNGVLGDIATATADFRDQYYGLASHVIDAADGDDARTPRLVTSGLIDPASLGWGRRSTRFNKVTYLHPRVVVDDLGGPLAAWAAARLVPKVLLATQTRVLEAVVDAEGSVLPSVPLITLTPGVDGDRGVAAGRPDHSGGRFVPEVLWQIAAVLTCPAVALEAARRHLGSGRNARALRLRAAEVLLLPLPADRVAWLEAASLLRAEAREPGARPLPEVLAEVGAEMNRAYGLIDDDELLGWWLDLLPRTR